MHVLPRHPVGWGHKPHFQDEETTKQELKSAWPKAHQDTVLGPGGILGLNPSNTCSLHPQQPVQSWELPEHLFPQSSKPPPAPLRITPPGTSPKQALSCSLPLPEYVSSFLHGWYLPSPEVPTHHSSLERPPQTAFLRVFFYYYFQKLLFPSGQLHNVRIFSCFSTGIVC